jgi:3-phenylpropionate/trans-cinnamate dioxygenase ferredoxin subunit
MENWIRACAESEVDREEVLRFDHAGRAFIIVHGEDGAFYCLDGYCSHEKIDLGAGLVMDHVIECPKHSGCFDYRTGEAVRAPACVNLGSYRTKVERGAVWALLG